MSGTGSSPRPAGAPSAGPAPRRTADAWGGWTTGEWVPALLRVQATVAVVVAVGLLVGGHWEPGLALLALAGLLTLVRAVWPADHVSGR